MSQTIVLIVDDNPTNLAVLFDYLEEMGYRVLIGTNGESALAATLQMPPDIILLDVMMPGIDGFETCRRLKANEVTKDIPVIFMTALADAVDEVQGLECGAVDYITKPIKVETVSTRIKTHLTLRRVQKELEEKNSWLQQALDNIKTLEGFIPICSNCKQVRDDEGFWQQVEVYVRDHSKAEFTHGICPDCMKRLYPELYNKLEKRRQDILDTLAELECATPEEISAAVGLLESDTLSCLESMREDGVVKCLEVKGQVLYQLR
ncbi:response regulator [Chloroflexota bacterium]